MTTKVIKDRYALRKEINEYLDQFDYEDMHDAWQKISRDRWLFDKDTSVEEAMILACLHSITEMIVNTV